MDPSVLLQAQGVRLADPMQYATQALSLADLASRREMQRYAIAKQRRDDEAAALLSRALPAFLRAGMTDEALAQAPPEVQQSLFAVQQKARKERADVDKTLAETDAKRADVKQKALRDISNVAYEEAKNPNNLSLSRVNRVAKFYGVDLPQMPTDPRDANGVRDYLSMLGNAGYDVKDRESLAETKRGHDLTAATAAEGQRVTMRGQDMTDARARQELAERIRNNNMTDARATEYNSVVSGLPQEVSVDGKPTLAIYDRRSGTFYDPNTKQPIYGGIGPKTPEMPASMIQAMAQNEVTISNIARAKQLVLESPQAFGAMNYLGDDIAQRRDPKGVSARAVVSDIGGQRIQDRSGAAVTVGEMERLRPYIPKVTDTPETIIKKLEEFERGYRQIQEELAQGRSLADVVRARNRDRASDQGAAPSKPPTAQPEWTDIGGGLRVRPAR